MAKVVLNSGGLEKVRDEYGLNTVQSLAERLGVDKGTVSRVTRGETLPRNRFIAAVITAFPNKFEDIFDVVSDGEENAA